MAQSKASSAVTPNNAPPRPEPAATFRVWLIVGTALLNALVIAVGYYNLHVSQERAIEQVRQTTGNLANLLRDNIFNSARGIDLALASITDSLERMQRNHHWRDESIMELLESHDRRHPEVAAFRVTDAKGDVRWGKGIDRNTRINLADREHFSRHLAEPGLRMLATEPILTRVQKTWAIVFTRSYRTPDGGFAGVVTAAVPVEHFTQMLAKLDLGALGSAVIRHENTALVTRHPPVDGPGGMTGSRNATPEFKAALDSGQFSVAYYTPRAPDGKARTMAFRRLEQLPFVILVGMAPEDYLMSWHRETQNTVLLLVSFLLVSVGAARLIWRYWRQHERDEIDLRARELELRESEQRLALATESGGIGVWDYDVANNRLLWDDRMYRIYGVAPEAFGGAFETWQAGVHPDDLAEASRAVAEAIDRRTPFRAEFRIVRPNGETRHVLANAKLVEDSSGAVAHMVGINIDITDRKRAEAALIEAKMAAEAASVAKSRFLATMSHEIRTPMNGILGMAQLLLMPGMDDAERREYVRTILNSGQTLLALLNDILDLSKIEAGKVELTPAVFQPQQLILETAALFEEVIVAKGLRLETAWLGAPDARYRADPIRLRQALSNLVGNAHKFTQTGFVRIEGSEIELAEHDALLEFTVTDSGVGIPVEKQSLLFKPFSQVDASITREYGGTGLGLSIVRNLAQLMRGDVGVESEVGKGSRFRFRVRVERVGNDDDSRRAARPPLPSAPPADTPRLVLLVEDNATNRLVIESILAKHGMRFESVENGLLAVERATAGPRPDLILMDCQMPVMNGYDATRRIRAWERENGQPRLPILALTAEAYAEDRQRCLDAGMDDFLAKPIDVARLLSALNTWRKPTVA